MSIHMSNTPGQPPPSNPNPAATPDPPASPVNPDPKAHPIHPPIPVQPIHEGTDPKHPVGAGDRGAGSDGSRSRTQ